MKLREKLQSTSNNYPVFDWDKILKQKPYLTATFVIPCFNSADSIELVIDSIINQDLSGNIKEIILVDDGSTDQTLTLVNKKEKSIKIPLKILKNSERMYAAFCRNMGIQESTGDLVCFLDSDIIIPPNYLQYHLLLHQYLPDCVSWSLRSFIEKLDFQELKSPFPVTNFVRDFRWDKIIPQEWCDSPERAPFASKKINLVKDTNYLRDLGYFKSYFWRLPETCLTCAICYNREDLLTIKGAPNNFKGWGFNDVSMAAKAISLGRYIVPVLEAGVYHINHPARSGESKYIEFNKNKERYKKMLEMTIEETYHWTLPNLE